MFLLAALLSRSSRGSFFSPRAPLLLPPRVKLWSRQKAASLSRAPGSFSGRCSTSYTPHIPQLAYPRRWGVDKAKRPCSP
jgi:hypothetical protein